MFTSREKEILALYTNDPTERYPQEVIHVFRGPTAFNLHAELLFPNQDSRDKYIKEWGSGNKIKNSFLVVTIMKVNSKAALKNPTKAPAVPRRQLRLHYFSTGKISVPSGAGYTSPMAKRWLKLIEKSPGDLM